jgi:hypothetical protein
MTCLKAPAPMRERDGETGSNNMTDRIKDQGSLKILADYFLRF